MLTTIHTSAVNGMAAMPVFLEVNANEIHSQEDRTIFFMVGLPDNAVRESKLRVESALQNSGFQLPLREKYTINCAPADVRKAKSAIRRAFKVQDLKLGFAFVEFLSICPTNWGLTAPKAMEWLRENMMPYYPVKQFKCPEEVKEVK